MSKGVRYVAATLFCVLGMVGEGAAENNSNLAPVPYVPAHDAPIVVAQADAAAGTTPPADYILKDCQETFHTPDPRSAFRAVDPAYMLKNYIEGRDVPLLSTLLTSRPLCCKALSMEIFCLQQAIWGG